LFQHIPKSEPPSRRVIVLLTRQTGNEQFESAQQQHGKRAATATAATATSATTGQNKSTATAKATATC